MLDLEIKLATGRQIFLDELFQSHTYAGWLEGKNSPSLNRSMLESHAEIASRIWTNDAHVTLRLSHYTSHLNDRLPGTRCMARFICYEPAAKSGKAGSSLVVIWFQEQGFPLLTDDNAPALRELAWEDLARDFDW
jgi:hypothetical protein